MTVTDQMIQDGAGISYTRTFRLRRGDSSEFEFTFEWRSATGYPPSSEESFGAATAKLFDWELSDVPTN